MFVGPSTHFPFIFSLMDITWFAQQAKYRRIPQIKFDG
jgi:hypothetical protein